MAPRFSDRVCSADFCYSVHNITNAADVQGEKVSHLKNILRGGEPVAELELAALRSSIVPGTVFGGDRP